MNVVILMSNRRRIHNNGKIVLLTLCLFLMACNGQVKRDGQVSGKKAVSVNQPNKTLLDLKNGVFDGDIESYKQLRIAYLDYPKENFLFWAILMSNKHNYAPAYLDVFYILVDGYGIRTERFLELDIRTQTLALEYLKIASEKGISEAKETLRVVESLGTDL